jgi:hypothetical protein
MSEDTTNGSLEAKLLHRVFRDPAFKKQLESEPKKTFEEFFEVTLPAGASVKIIHEKPNEYTIVIPHVTDDVAAALSEQNIQEYLEGGGLYAALSTCTACGSFI